MPPGPGGGAPPPPPPPPPFPGGGSGWSGQKALNMARLLAGSAPVVCPVIGSIILPGISWVQVAHIFALFIVRDSALWASMPTSSLWYTVILSEVSFMVLITLQGGEEGGVDGLVSLKRFNCCSCSDASELSSPSRVLRMSCSSSSVRVLRGILSCRLSAAILNVVHLLLLLSLCISNQAGGCG